GSSEREAGAAIIGVVAAIIKLNVDISGSWIDRHPLEELINTVVHWIVVHTHGLRPCSSLIFGGNTKDVYIAVAVVAPAQIKDDLLRIARINADLRETHNAGYSGNSSSTSEIWRCHVDGLARRRKRSAAIVGFCEGDGAAIIPDRVNGAIGRHNSHEPHQTAIVITWQ